MAIASLENEQVVKIGSQNGIEVYHVKAQKFKTNSINIFFCDELSELNATENSVMLSVLKSGSEKFPKTTDIYKYTEALYGASFDCGISKKGELSIMQFYAEHVADRFTGSKSEIFDKALDLIIEVTTRPVLSNQAFKEEYVTLEKNNIKTLIESRINDKVQYTTDRCLEETCKDESYRVYTYGSVDKLTDITPKNLYQHYLSVKSSAPVYVFVSGNITQKNIDSLVSSLSSIQREKTKVLNPGYADKNPVRPQTINETMDITQGKLSLGFRTNTPPDSKDYYALLMYNSILGGGVHSKMFQNVREKEGLAYYGFSRLEKFKGLMVIGCGIEVKNKDKVLDIIMKQMDDIKNAEISEFEHSSAIKNIETSMKALQDNQLGLVDFYLSQALSKTSDSPSDIIEKTSKITPKDIAEIAQKIKLDTVYFLSHPTEGGSL